LSNISVRRQLGKYQLPSLRNQPILLRRTVQRRFLLRRREVIVVRVRTHHDRQLFALLGLPTFEREGRFTAGIKLLEIH
jgi:hypothetical protein